MIILSAKDITKNYGVDVILDKVSFHINEGDRIGIVGANGAGKTTLLNILAGELPADGGDYFLSQDKTIGYLKQKNNFETENTVIEEVHKIFRRLADMEQELLDLSSQIAEKGAEAGCLMNRYASLQDTFKSEGGYSYKSEITGILNSMAFGEEFYDKKISTLSGGERTRLALACLLLEKPDMLFLDEPTNHLDIGTLKWLEQYLRGYKGTIVMVSHDRYFLDQMATRIFEMEHHHLKAYEGNYSAYAEKKRALREAELRAYNKQQTEIRRQEDMIRRFKERGTEKLAKRAASREKRLSHLERLERPEAELGKMKIHFRQEYQSGYDVLYGEGLAKSFGFGAGRRELFSHVDFDIKRGERICIVGPNGVGKTTLLRILMEELSPTEGYLKIGHNVKFGYYDQGQLLLNDAATVMDEVHDSYRLYKDAEIRSILGRFLFKNDQVFLQVGSLSGGEKARLSLLKLMMSGANVLLLDEPTNHLDIDSKEVFEDALLEYPGTVIVVSHDRYFLNKIPTRILELEKDGLREYLGTYDYYVEKKASVESGRKYLRELGGAEPGAGASKAVEPAKGKSSGGNSFDQGRKLSSAEERALKKEKEAEERRLAREKDRLEALIEELETAIAENEAQMCLPENLANHQLLTELDQKNEKCRNELEEAYEKWMALA